jgi:hypothetical protein
MKYERIMNSVSCFGEFLGENWRFKKNSNVISTKFSVLLTSITTFSSSHIKENKNP